MFKHTMYFGQSKPDGTIVTEKEFTEFLKEVVSKEFSGFTVTNALGYWEGKPELSKVLTILSYGSRQTSSCISIAKEYCKRFQQESVMVEFMMLSRNISCL